MYDIKHSVYYVMSNFYIPIEDSCIMGTPATGGRRPDVIRFSLISVIIITVNLIIIRFLVNNVIITSLNDIIRITVTVFIRTTLTVFIRTTLTVII